MIEREQIPMDVVFVGAGPANLAAALHLKSEAAKHAELLYDERDAVIGIRTGDKGIDKDGKQKANFEPGVDLLAKVTVLGEGSRGSLTKQLVARLGLDDGKE